MRKKIKEIIKRSDKVYKIFWGINTILKSQRKPISGMELKYPKVLQLPLTFKCNSKCSMCNIWKIDNPQNMRLEDLKRYLSDPIFKEIEAVGINGGEPTIIPNLELYVDEILKLPQLNSLSMITNGFNTDVVLEKTKLIYEKCKKQGVSFNLSISLDGHEEIHNKVRGIPNIFYKVTNTINSIYQNIDQYCDDLELGCTVQANNIDNLIELDTYAKKNKYKIKYRVGILNRRIDNFEIFQEFNVLENKNRQTAKEFFHDRANKEGNLFNKFKYYSIFKQLENDTNKRLFGCAWKDEGITLNPDGEIAYCAVESNNLGSLNNVSGEDAFFYDENLKSRAEIIKNKCGNCIHDYSGKIEQKNIIGFFKDIIMERIWWKVYKFKGMF